MKLRPDRLSDLFPVKLYSPRILLGAFGLLVLLSPASCSRPLRPGLGWPWVFQEGFSIMPFLGSSKTTPANFFFDYLVAYAIVVIGVWFFHRVGR